MMGEIREKLGTMGFGGGMGLSVVALLHPNSGLLTFGLVMAVLGLVLALAARILDR
jgi:hypothetical protein